MTDRQTQLEPLLAALEADEISRNQPDLTRYEIGGLAPQIVLAPRSVEGVRTVMRIAQEQQIAVVPAGSGSNVGTLNAPSRYDATLSLEKLDRILEYDADNCFVRVQAGCRLGTLEDALASKGQHLPLDFPSRSDGTVGGRLSTPRVGVRCPFLGCPRDVALGLAAVLPGGRLIRPGGLTTKNVAGYDLTRLLVGSCGSLGIIVEANLRTAPAPECARALDVRFATSSKTFDFACAILRSRHCPSFATVLPDAAFTENKIHPASSTTVLLGAEGFEKDVSSQFAHFRAAASHAGASDVNETPTPYRDLTDAMLRAGDPSPDELIVRVSAPMTALHRSAPSPDDASAIAFVGAGVIVIRAKDADARAVLKDIDRRCAESGAHRHVVSAPPEIKRSIDAWSPRGESDALVRAIKNAFDPADVLAPGVMPGRL